MSDGPRTRMPGYQAFHLRWSQLLEPDRDRRRSKLSGAGEAHPLPQLSGVRVGGPRLLRPSCPEGYLAEWTQWLASTEQPVSHKAGAGPPRAIAIASAF